MRLTHLLLGGLFAVAFLLFFTKAAIVFDPDFGYRVSTGIHILEHGIPATDLYSYTMPSHPYIEHSLLIAILWGSVYPWVGYTGIALMSTIIGSLTLVLLYKQALRLAGTATKPHLDTITLAIFSIGTSSFLAFFGVRAQVVSWLLFTILYILIVPYRMWDRIKLLVPIFFVVWANTHGSFIAGLVLLGVYIAGRTWEDRRLSWQNIMVMFLAMGATALTPYGIGMWQESLASITDSNMRTYIYEWMPPFFSMSPALGTYLVLSFVCIVRFWQSIPFALKLILITTLLGALSSTRNVPIYILFSLPIVAAYTWTLKTQIAKIPYGLNRFGIVSSILLAGMLILSTLHAYHEIAHATSFSENNAYPRGAITYLTKNPPQGNIFSQFYWGGYLSLTYPQKKVYIDGKMTSWRSSNPPEGESSAAFLDYIALLEGNRDYAVEFEKYDIDTVVWATPAQTSETTASPLAPLIQTLVQAEDVPRGLTERLLEDNWEVVYRDSVATIYKHPKSNN